MPTSAQSVKQHSRTRMLHILDDDSLTAVRAVNLDRLE